MLGFTKFQPNLRELFRDHTGKEIDTQTIRKTIDAYLPKVKPFEQWVLIAKSQSEHSRYTSKFPYKLHLLTISPIVVLVVPISPSERFGCNGQSGRDGYISSGLLLPACYRYLEPPSVAQGSFWFSPEDATGIHYLPDEKDSITIQVNGSSVDLAKSDGHWLVMR